MIEDLKKYTIIHNALVIQTRLRLNVIVSVSYSMTVTKNIFKIALNLNIGNQKQTDQFVKKHDSKRERKK